VSSGDWSRGDWCRPTRSIDRPIDAAHDERYLGLEAAGLKERSEQRQVAARRAM
jgi:hypothetical protein